MIGDPDALRFELVSPSGERIDAGTPALDPPWSPTPTATTAAVVHRLPGRGAEPGAGRWRWSTPAPSRRGAHAVAVAAPTAPAGIGVSLTADLAPLQVAGEAVTMTATLTEDGLAVTGATVVRWRPPGRRHHHRGRPRPRRPGRGDHRRLPRQLRRHHRGRPVRRGGRRRARRPSFTRQQLLQFSKAGRRRVLGGDLGPRRRPRRRRPLRPARRRGRAGGGRGRHLPAVRHLTDGAGTAIEQVRVERELPPGLHTVPLAFDGATLSALGHDGPYLVEDLVLEEVASATGLAVGPPYTTAAYAPTDFQRPPLLLTGVTGDRGSHDQPWTSPSRRGDRWSWTRWPPGRCKRRPSSSARTAPTSPPEPSPPCSSRTNLLAFRFPPRSSSAAAGPARTGSSS